MPALWTGRELRSEETGVVLGGMSTEAGMPKGSKVSSKRETLLLPAE